MSYKIIPTEKFKKEAKRLVRKFPSLKQELQDLVELLQQSPESGTALGNDTYKVQLAIKSKAKGKSGGARVITYVIAADLEVYLLTIYDKSELENVDDKMLRQVIKTLRQRN